MLKILFVDGDAREIKWHTICSFEWQMYIFNDLAVKSALNRQGGDKRAFINNVFF